MAPEPPTEGPPQKTTSLAAPSVWQLASNDTAADRAEPVHRPARFLGSPAAASASATSSASAAAAAAARAAILPGRGPIGTEPGQPPAPYEFGAPEP
eukprot:scaffold89231_cov25-Tisochrysis_lutea.AAC.3